MILANLFKKDSAAMQEFWQDCDVRLDVPAAGIAPCPGEGIVAVLAGVTYHSEPGILTITNLRAIWQHRDRAGRNVSVGWSIVHTFGACHVSLSVTACVSKGETQSHMFALTCPADEEGVGGASRGGVTPHAFHEAERVWRACRATRAYRGIKLRHRGLFDAPGSDLIALPSESVLQKIECVRNVSHKTLDDPRPGTLFVTDVQIVWADDVGLFNVAIPHIHIASMRATKSPNHGHVLSVRTDSHAKHLTLGFAVGGRRDTERLCASLKKVWKAARAAPNLGIGESGDPLRVEATNNSMNLRETVGGGVGHDDIASDRRYFDAVHELVALV